jgi:hypothetical protein
VISLDQSSLQYSLRMERGFHWQGRQRGEDLAIPYLLLEERHMKNWMYGCRVA